MLDDVREGLGDEVHVLVNNAARTEFRSFWEIDLDEWDDVLATNLRGTYLGCRVVGAYLRERRAGRIVNLASDAGQKASGASGVHYAASKAAIVALTRRAATEPRTAGRDRECRRAGGDRRAARPGAPRSSSPRW